MSSYRYSLLFVALTGVMGCNQQDSAGAAFSNPEALLASCQNALAKNDLQTASKICVAAEYWLAATKPDSVEHANSIENVADFQMTQGAVALAVENYKNSILLHDRVADNSDAVKKLQIKYANTLSDQGRWQDAEAVYGKVLPTLTADSLDAADVLNRLGFVQLKQQRLPDAEQSLGKAVKIREAKLKPTDLALNETYTNLGLLYQAAGKNAEAESFYRKADANEESMSELPLPTLYETLGNLATLLQRQSKFQDAEPVWRKQLIVAEKAYGKDSAQYATTLQNLGSLALAVKNYAAAEPLLTEAVTIRQNRLGLTNPLTAETSNDLAVALFQQGKLAQAEPYIRHAAAVSYVDLGIQNPLTQQRWNSLITLENLIAARTNRVSPAGQQAVQQQAAPQERPVARKGK